MSVQVGKILFHTEPHGSHAVELVEDAVKPRNRIFVIVGDDGGRLSILGEELDSLAGWWRREQEREGHE